MPLLKRKAVEDLQIDKDILYSRAGNIAPAGAVVTESLMQRLLRYKVPIITTIVPSREETAIGAGTTEVEKAIKAKEGGEFSTLRARLFESVKKIYKPYSETTNRAFWGKLGEKLIKPDFLLEQRPDSLYRQGIYEGSMSIFGTSEANNQFNDRKAVMECLDDIYSLCESGKAPRIFLDSIRMGAIYDTGVKDRIRILDPGNSFAWHATDTAILTLAALVSMSRKRKAEGLPESIEEFEKQKNLITSHKTISVKAERFHYPRETVLDAALGCLLHALGFAHVTTNRVASKRPMLDESPLSQDAIKVLRKSQFVVRNLFEDRGDISAITKKVIFQMKRYPDGCGYPLIDPSEAQNIPEYARMANIADDYDELVNPVVHPHPMGRTEAVSYLKRRAGDYRPATESARYDKVLLDEFIGILKPYEENERVDLFMEGKRSRKYYCGYVHSYGEATGCPLVCVLKNAVAGESYAFGRVVFDIEGKKILLFDERGKAGAVIDRDRMDEKDVKGEYRIRNETIRGMLRQLPDLVALDAVKDAWSVEEYRDPAFDVRKAAR